MIPADFASHYMIAIAVMTINEINEPKILSRN